jgi:hypothetical protein
VEPAVNHIRKQRVPDLLLRDCLSLGGVVHERPPARQRLEETLGPELTERLLRSLMSDKQATH